MSQPSPYASYRQTQIGTANQLRLIIMLHDGVIRFLRQALAGMEKKDYYMKGSNLNKALDIIFHLWSSLDTTPGNEIAENMSSLFQYMRNILVMGNAKNDPAPFLEVIGYFRTFRDAWEEVERKGGDDSRKKPAQQGELSRAA